MGVDVMRWMYARQRPEDNILFGYHAADESRRDLLVLWNVAAFFIRYAAISHWRPPSSASPWDEAPHAVLDRWLLSRVAGVAATVRTELADFDARAASIAVGGFIDDLSQWYLRRSRRRFSRNDDAADSDAAFATLHRSLVALARICAPILPFLTEELYQVLVAELDTDAVPSVHLTPFPDAEVAGARDPVLEAAMATLRRAVDLCRTLRGQAGIRLRQPIGRLWLALPAGRLAPDLAAGDEAALLEILAYEVNVKGIELIDDSSELVERRVKPLLPVIGRRLGAQVPSVMAAARQNDVEFLPDGGVRLAGVVLSADEVEILATPRPGTAVADDDGVVVVIDTTLTPELRAEGDLRELTRAIQDLRKQAALSLDERIEVWVEADGAFFESVDGRLDAIAQDTLADAIHREPLPPDLPLVELDLDGGRIRAALRPVRPPGGPAEALP